MKSINNCKIPGYRQKGEKAGEAAWKFPSACLSGLGAIAGKWMWSPTLCFNFETQLWSLGQKKHSSEVINNKYIVRGIFYIVNMKII